MLMATKPSLVSLDALCSKKCCNYKMQLKTITTFYMNFDRESSCSKNELEVATVVLRYLYEPLIIPAMFK